VHILLSQAVDREPFDARLSAFAPHAFTIWIRQCDLPSHVAGKPSAQIDFGCAGNGTANR
jgi:hypothetical protein